MEIDTILNETYKATVETWLIEHGFDGLYSDSGDCGCAIGDLFPCNTLLNDVWWCAAGYKVPCDCDEDHEFHVVETKPEREESNVG